MTALQVAHRILHLILQMPPPANEGLVNLTEAARIEPNSSVLQASALPMALLTNPLL